MIMGLLQLAACALAILTLAKAAAGQPDLPYIGTDDGGNLHINTSG